MFVKHSVVVSQRNIMEALSLVTEQLRKGRSREQAIQDLSFKPLQINRARTVGNKPRLVQSYRRKTFILLFACCFYASQNVKNSNKSPHLTSNQAGTLTAFPTSIKCFSFLKDFTLFTVCVYVFGICVL